MYVRPGPGMATPQGTLSSVVVLPWPTQASPPVSV